MVNLLNVGNIPGSETTPRELAIKQSERKAKKTKVFLKEWHLPVLQTVPCFKSSAHLKLNSSSARRRFAHNVSN